MNKKRIGIVAIVLILILLIIFRLVANKQKIEARKTVTTETNVQIPVNVVPVAYADINESLVRTGTLIPYHEADITATTSGTLSSVSFSLGQYISKGSVAAQIDNGQLQLRLDAARLQAQKLQEDYNRYSRLLQGDATTKANVDEIRFNLNTANNQVSQIRRQMTDNIIKAPISGQVVAKNLEAGEFVNPGTVLGKIVDVSTLKADLQVPERDAYSLRPGQSVRITTDLYPGQAFSGKVLFVSQQGDAAHNYQVQVTLSNPATTPLKAGTIVYAAFEQRNHRAVLQLPRTALVESTKNPFVYVVQGGKAVQRKITVGQELGANIEVTEGLQPGEQVVVNGQINITNGTPVRVVK